MEQRDLRRWVSQHNKTKTLRMRNVDGRKFTEKKKKKKKKKNKVEEFQLAKFASLGSLASKNLLLSYWIPHVSAFLPRPGKASAIVINRGNSSVTKRLTGTINLTRGDYQ